MSSLSGLLYLVTLTQKPSFWTNTWNVFVLWNVCFVECLFMQSVIIPNLSGEDRLLSGRHTSHKPDFKKNCSTNHTSCGT